MRLLTLLVLVPVASAASEPRQAPPAAQLTARKVLRADTFADGPPSGGFLKNGVRATPAPFPSQPVQGFSSIWPAANGWWWALVDNGYGTRLNSPDFLLRIYRIAPHFDEASAVEVAASFVQLRDPDRRVPFHIVHEDTAERLLTGADFDPESMVRMDDGSFWIGDEFGPFLVHVSAEGVVLDAPVEAAGIRSPDNPFTLPPDGGRISEATVARSRGFEGLALAPGGRLIALLEGGTIKDAGRYSRALEFDPRTRAFTGREWRIPFEAAGHSFTELVHYEHDRYLLIERDNLQGNDARFKRVFVVTLPSGAPGRKGPAYAKEGPAYAKEGPAYAKEGPADAKDGPAYAKEGPAYAQKRLVLDLLAIADPEHRGGTSDIFTFPFITTEALWPIDEHTLVLVNDNNYPETGGRARDTKDDSEFIRVKIE